MIREAIEAIKNINETELHNYDKNSKEELLLLLKHHKEDLAEYKERGDDVKEILHDIEEIEVALQNLEK